MRLSKTLVYLVDSRAKVADPGLACREIISIINIFERQKLTTSVSGKVIIHRSRCAILQKLVVGLYCADLPQMLHLSRSFVRRPGFEALSAFDQQVRNASKKSLARGKRLRGGGAIPGIRFGGKLSTDMNGRGESMIDAIRIPTPVTNPIKRWRILRGDFVEVISGHHTGQRGRVIEVVRASNRVVVEGVNMVKKKVLQPGGYSKIYETESPVYVSRVAVVCPKTDLPTRLTFAYTEDGTKVRVSKKSGSIIPRPEILRQRRKPHPEDSSKDTPAVVALHRSFDDEEGLYEHYEGFKALVDKSI